MSCQESRLKEFWGDDYPTVKKAVDKYPDTHGLNKDERSYLIAKEIRRLDPDVFERVIKRPFSGEIVTL